MKFAASSVSLALSFAGLLISTAPEAFAQHAGHGSSAAPPAEAEHPGQGTLSATALQSLAVAISDAGGALATDDFQLYQSLRLTVRNALHDLADAEPELAAGLTETPADPLPHRGQLTDARNDFVRFSTAVADVVRNRKVHQSANLHIFECTMAPQIGTGRWLQRDAEAKNPFFGSAMLKCGVELDRKTSARALPPGHPPIEGLTPADYTRYVDRNRGPAASGGCGGCGVSKGSMAVGGANEHTGK